MHDLAQRRARLSGRASAGPRPRNCPRS
jgi:hypothetical protein